MNGPCDWEDVRDWMAKIIRGIRKENRAEIRELIARALSYKDLAKLIDTDEAIAYLDYPTLEILMHKIVKGTDETFESLKERMKAEMLMSELCKSEEDTPSM